MNVRRPHLEFGSLSERPYTDQIVVHHTGEPDMDASAEQIHQWHLNQGWSGIGYHFVIRKDGTLEIGRPEWAIGSHAYGENFHTLGIHLSGDFEAVYPSESQIVTCAELVADLCSDYNIPCDRSHVVGHCDLMPTDCPGKNLYAKIDRIIALANASKVNAADFQLQTNDFQPPAELESIFDLARKFESNSDPAAIGHGYGLYQFATSTVNAFVYWLKNYPDDKLANYGRHLADAKNFDGEWQMLGTVDPGHFGALQDEFAKKIFFDETADLLSKENFNVEKHSVAMQAVIFARAIQHGVFGAIELFKRACPYPNLSYVDDALFDRELIAAVYDYLIANPAYGRANHKYDAALKKRFIAEKEAALG